MKDTSILTIIVTAVVGIILLGSLLMPVIDSPGVTKEKVVGTNENELYRLSNDFSEEVEIEISSGAIVNGDQVTPSTNPVIVIFSDKFVITWYKADTDANVCDADLGYVSNVVKINLETDGTYSYTKTDSSVVTSTGAFSWIFYPSNTGDFGSFRSGVNIDLGEKWYSCKSSLGASPWNPLILTMDGDQNSLTAKTAYVAANTTSPFVEGGITVGYKEDYLPTVSSDGLSYMVSNPQWTRTVTVSSTDYTISDDLTPVIAPLHYHYYVEKEMESSLLGVIPVLIIVAILLSVVQAVVRNRND